MGGDTKTTDQSSGEGSQEKAAGGLVATLGGEPVGVVTDVEIIAPKARKGKAAEPETTQAEPTAPRPIDADTGLELDEHGLPTSGPARRRWLADAGIEDPALKTGAEEENADG